MNLDEAHTLVIRSAFTQVPSPLAVSLAKSNLSLEKVAQPQPFTVILKYTPRLAVPSSDGGSPPAFL